MKKYNKLVRDKIPEICEASGAVPHTRVLTDDAEFLGALCSKLLEESEELKKTPVLNELADVQEVLNEITRQLGYTTADVEVVRAQKANERGGFNERIFLISTDEA